MEREKMCASLKNLRRIHGKSQAYYAEKFGISQNHWANIENGKRFLPLQLAQKVSNEFHIPLPMVFNYLTRYGHLMGYGK